MTKNKKLLEDIYDVLAHNTHYVQPSRIVDEFDIQVDFNTNEITLFDPITGDVVVVLKAEFPI